MYVTLGGSCACRGWGSRNEETWWSEDNLGLSSSTFYFLIETGSLIGLELDK